MAAKPIKTLESHYTMIQFLIIQISPFCSLVIQNGSGVLTSSAHRRPTDPTLESGIHYCDIMLPFVCILLNSARVPGGIQDGVENGMWKSGNLIG